jgi:UDP-N-acetylmuramate dehydrogenase
MLTQWKNEIVEILGKENVQFDEPMKNHTSFHIGGPADIFASPETIEQIRGIKIFCEKKQIPLYMMGNGSNLLVDDKGYKGCILQVGNHMSKIEVKGTRLIAQSGTLLSKLANVALEAGLAGLEFASGIPGSVGGAVVMNAGAYDGQMMNVVEQVKVLDEKGKEVIFTNEEMEFGYRFSILKQKPYIVTEVTFLLALGNLEDIRKKQDNYTKTRTEKQPLTYPSAGSTFKRPDGYYVGKLIMDVGLKGFAIGDAQVSEKHCGFIINRGNATAKDVKELIAYIQKEVNDRFSVMLEPEVIFLEAGEH